jgi:hypothetical protein
MKVIELEKFGMVELNLSEIQLIDGGDANGTMAGGSLSLDWASSLIGGFAKGILDGWNSFNL